MKRSSTMISSEHVVTKDESEEESVKSDITEPPKKKTLSEMGLRNETEVRALFLCNTMIDKVLRNFRSELEGTGNLQLTEKNKQTLERAAEVFRGFKQQLKGAAILELNHK